MVTVLYKHIVNNNSIKVNGKEKFYVVENEKFYVRNHINHKQKNQNKVTKHKKEETEHKTVENDPHIKDTETEGKSR